MAGLLDGEGTIGISKSTVGGVLRRPHWRRPGTLYIVISNTDRPVLEWVRERCGGVVGAFSSQRKPGWKRAYKWQLRDRAGSLAFLRTVGPHLRIKRMQASLALDWLVSPNRMEDSERVRLAIAALNARGPRTQATEAPSVSKPMDAQLKIL